MLETNGHVSPRMRSSKTVVVADSSRCAVVLALLAVPATSAQRAADDLIGAGVKIIFNYSEALLDVPTDVAVHTSNPAVELLYALYFHLT